jgi:protein-S-isoprenylcysteine O-methyltransferase Ste14
MLMLPMRDVLLRIRTVAALDVLERVIVMVLYGPLCWRLVLAFAETNNWTYLLLLLSEGAAVGLILVRRSTDQVTGSPKEWTIAVVGTVMPLLAIPGGGDALAPELVYIVLMLAGVGLQIAAKLTLRRSFGVVAANRGVKIGGPYMIVRHPMYAGYTLTHIAFFLLNPSWWNLIVHALGLSCQVFRIFSEERLLSYDPSYRLFRGSVRYRLVPGVF